MTDIDNENAPNNGDTCRTFRISAWETINYLIELGEHGSMIEAISFGAWRNCEPIDIYISESPRWYLADDEPHGEAGEPAVPYKLRGKALTLEEAEPFMHSWSFEHDDILPSGYTTCVWTEKNIIIFKPYSNWLRRDIIPRSPVSGRIPSVAIHSRLPHPMEGDAIEFIGVQYDNVPPRKYYPPPPPI